MEERVGRSEPLEQQIALFSAILATLGEIISGTVLMNARASDNWSYYQAEDLKRHLAEATAAMVPTARHDDAAGAARYAAKAKALRATADGYDCKSEKADAASHREQRPHSRLAIAMTFLQVGIALAFDQRVAHRRWLLWGAGLSGALGIGLAFAAWF